MSQNHRPAAPAIDPTKKSSLFEVPFKLKAMGLAPTEMHIGRRVLISHEAAEIWRREREHDANQLRSLRSIRRREWPADFDDARRRTQALDFRA